MKKLLVLLCLSVMSVAVSAQTFSQSGKNFLQKKGAQKQEQTENFSSLADKVNNGKTGVFGKRLEAHSFAHVEAEVARQVAQAQMQQPSVTTTSGENDIDHDHPVIATPSDRPSYYATEEAYQSCKVAAVCENWARQQAQEEVHFQVLSATLVQKEDLHHSRLIVKYSKYQDEQEKVFEEDFEGWKEK